MRVAYQALSAVLGGTQSLHTNSRDEALALPSEDSVLIALRTQQVIAYETGVTDTIDPLGGSYYIESLTNQVEKATMAYLDKIEEMGGAVRAIEEGFQQMEIQDSAYNYQLEIESGDRVVIGVNKFQIAEKSPQNLLRVDPVVEETQRGNLQAVKQKRNGAEVDRTLARLKEAAEATDNLLPPVLDAVRAYATLGEISDVLRDVFGEYQQRAIF
jgi:methylmalonyl-CoA mutase N-terminal domain/subunit